jgi:hypothetical protein
MYSIDRSDRGQSAIISHSTSLTFCLAFTAALPVFSLSPHLQRFHANGGLIGAQHEVGGS